MTFVDELTPDMSGRYLVTTQGSTHLWDLDEGYYIRNPSPESIARGHMPDFASNRPLNWISVEWWPKVGHTFYTVLSGDMPWHRSSTIKSIEVLEDE